MFGQPCGQRCTYLLRVGPLALPRFRDEVGHESAYAGCVLPGQDRGLGDVGVGLQDRDDLPGLHTVATDLDLVVGTAEEVHEPVGAPTNQVTGAVHECAGRAEGVGHESFGGRAGSARIATGEPDPGHVQLPGDPGRERGQSGVEHVDASVVDGCPDGGGGAVLGTTAKGVDRVFGGAVEVVPEHAGGVPEPLPDGVGDRFPAEQDQAGAVPVLLQQPVLDELSAVGGGHVDDVDVVLGAVGGQCVGVAAHLLVHQVHLVSLDQPEQLFPGHVEGERDGVRNAQDPPVLFGDDRVEDAFLVVDQHVGQTTQGYGHTLGSAGRSRGVDGVGQGFGGDRSQQFGVGDVVRRQRGQFGLGSVGSQDHGLRTLGARDPARGGFVHQQDRGGGVGEHVGQPRLRVVQVQGHVCGPGLEDGEQPRHGVHRPWHPQGDIGFGGHALGDQQSGDAVGAAVEFGEGHAAPVEDQGGAFGVTGRGFLQEPGDGVGW